MTRWEDFEKAEPKFAQRGRTLIYQHTVGLGYLATLRKDGGPRVHPVCPTLANGGLYLFIGNHSPKLHDLHRDGRYALHTFPVPEGDDEFYVSGRALPIDDPDVRKIVYDVYVATGATTSNDTLFELSIERALYAEYGERPSWPPVCITLAPAWRAISAEASVEPSSTTMSS